MSDREKLTEMIQESTGCVYCGDVCVNEEIDIDDQEIARIVDHLITNGVTVQVHGEWEHLGGDEWCCTVCENVIITEGSWEKPTQKFCDECGAKMREDDGEKRRTNND